jgi:hypothetical protein
MDYTPTWAKTGQVGGTGGAGPLLAKVCPVPAGVRLVANVPSCDNPTKVFQTSELNVPRHNSGDEFPGIGQHPTSFAVFYEGMFEVSQVGLYRFRLFSDDGSILYIDGKQVVDNDGWHQPEGKAGEIQLAAGVHRIKVKYFELGPYDFALQLFVRAPGTNIDKLYTPHM